MPDINSKDFPQPAPDDSRKLSREELAQAFTMDVSRMIPKGENSRFRTDPDRKFVATEELDSKGNTLASRDYFQYFGSKEGDRGFLPDRTLMLVREKDGNKFGIRYISLDGEITENKDLVEGIILSFTNKIIQPVSGLETIDMTMDNRSFSVTYDRNGEISRAMIEPKMEHPISEGLLGIRGKDILPNPYYINKQDIDRLKHGFKIELKTSGGLIVYTLTNGILNLQRIDGNKVLDVINLPFIAPSSGEVTKKLLDPDTIDDPYEAPTDLDRKWESFPQVMAAADITWERH